MLIAAWSALVVGGLAAMLRYENAPGFAGSVSERWPQASHLQRDADRAHLVMFAHPHCPCTRASLEELAHVMTACQGLVTADVLFFQPSAGADWQHTDLCQAAQHIPGVRVQADVAGRDRSRFGVKTSGHTLLYDANGKLVFSGGITGSRGHSGENAGRSSIVVLLTTGQVQRIQTPTFGCSL